MLQGKTPYAHVGWTTISTFNKCTTMGDGYVVSSKHWHTDFKCNASSHGRTTSTYGMAIDIFDRVHDVILLLLLRQLMVWLMAYIRTYLKTALLVHQVGNGNAYPLHLMAVPPSATPYPTQAINPGGWWLSTGQVHAWDTWWPMICRGNTICFFLFSHVLYE